MKYLPSFLILFLLFSASCKTPKKASADLSDEPTYTLKTTEHPGDRIEVRGRVTHKATGEPLFDVRIIAIGENGNRMVAVSDINGEFILEHRPCTLRALEVSTPYYMGITIPLELKSCSNVQVDIQLYRKPMMVEKPVIYLYPEKDEEIHLSLDYKGQIVHSYPVYPEGGWKVSASPDGRLRDQNGMEYYALFWEGLADAPIVPHDGFIVPGNETAAFLEEKLAYLGLNRREANEFIVYWLPRMEKNPYNLIHFSGSEYEDLAGLHVSPQPESIIRVMMVTQALPAPIDFPLQDLSPLKKTRKGYTLVEWGGCVTQAVPLLP